MSLPAKDQVRVMHIVSGLHIGGAEMMLYRLLTRSSLQGTVVVSLSVQGELTAKIRQLGIEVIELPRSSLLASYQQLSALLEQHQPSVIQSWLYRADLLAALVAWRKKVPVIWNVRQTAVNKVSGQTHIWIVQRLNAALSTWLPEKIVYCAKAAQDSHEAMGFDRKKSLVISNGVDTEFFAFNESQRRAQRQQWQVFNNDVLIGMVGRFDPLKNHGRFLRIIKRVVDACPKAAIKAVLVGRGISEKNTELQQSIKACALENHVVLVDEVADVVSAYSAMDVHILTSDNEGWPNVLGEAMSMGLPCVSTNVGDANLMLHDSSAAIAPIEEEAFAQKVIEYVQLPAGERWKLAKANREHIQQKFSLQGTVERYDDLYFSFSRF